MTTCIKIVPCVWLIVFAFKFAVDKASVQVWKCYIMVKFETEYNAMIFN